MLKYVIGLIVVVVIAAAAFLITGRDNNQNIGTSSPPPASQNTTPPPSNNSSPSASNKVTITNFSFSPTDVIVKKGTTVTWTNNDSVQHTVTVDSGDDGPKSQPLSSGQAYSFTFNDEGTFNYHCSFHPEMHGTVTVTE